MGLFSKKIDPVIFELATEFEERVDEAQEEIQKQGYEYPILCLDTAIMIVDYFIEGAQQNNTDPYENRWFSIRLSLFVQELPNDWSMQHLFAIFVGSPIAAESNTNFVEWLKKPSNQKAIKAVLDKKTSLKTKLHLQPSLTSGCTLEESLPPDLRDEMNKLLNS